MKKIVLALVAMFTLSTAAMAQSEEKKQNRPSKAEMAQRMTDRMSEQLGLTADQKAKVLDLNTRYADKLRFQGPRRGRGPQGGPRRGFKNNGNGAPQARGERPQLNDSVKAKMAKAREEMKATHEAYEKELKSILTSDQLKKYEEQRQQMRRAPRGQRGPQSRQQKLGSDDANA